MNILLAGNLTTLATTLSKDLARDKNKIILAAKNIETIFSGWDSKLILHSISPSDPNFSDILSSYKFETVVYFPSREEQMDFESQSESGQHLDGLKNVLELSRIGSVEKFFYISSTEVYGDMPETGESLEPNPASLNGFTLFAGEKYCRYYSEKYDLNTIIVRVPFVYGAQEKNSLIFDLISKSNDNNVIPLGARKDKLVNFLHSIDFTQFIRLAINELFDESHVVINLSSNEDFTLEEISHLFVTHFPEVKFSFSDENNLYTRPAEVDLAKRQLGWIDTHKFRDDFPDLIDEVLHPVPEEKTGFQRLISRYFEFRYILRWIELGVGAILMHLLSEMSGTLIQFKYVDFRLVFVVLMGTVYGMRFGLYAAILASLSILYKWFQLGLDWELLTQNVGNWFPFVFYFAMGVVIGFIRDRKETEIAYEKKQTRLIYEKYSFLYNVFNEIRNLKDDFREQLVGYRESFGRVLKVSQELDMLQEEAVFLKALNILEDILENESVAIYSMSAKNYLARLEVSSAPLQDELSKSINLKDYPEVISPVEKGLTFQNKSLLPDYPSYVAPIMNSDKPVALVVLWNARFEDYSENYHNLFKVICGFFQASLVRAALFASANSENIYLPATRILQPDAFYRALQIKEEMRRNKIADYQLVRIHWSGKKYEELNSKISEKIRDSDLIGLDEEKQVYIILSQAGDAQETKILERLGESIKKFEVVDTKDILAGKIRET